ncbi:hypothetical protein SLEP1_g951 [Rubroshorea leprosula]|uniref:Ankyrin repeat protein n=1 Tax=Rubroshorea leprosula TaxID=152421 RepID=A0AAV5HC89_9ROSI|nr:hypothetical protein SLEP1_g951 [Rubroshorea leprosula]
MALFPVASCVPAVPEWSLSGLMKHILSDEAREDAIYCDPTDAIVLSKQRLCFTRLNEGELALKDDEACIALRPDWPKAYYRGGCCTDDFDKAADSFHHGLKLDHENGELRRAFRQEAIEAKKNKLCGFPNCEHLPAWFMFFFGWQLSATLYPNVIACHIFSPLTMSVEAGSIECVKLLLKAGADPNLSAPMGMAPLGSAAAKGLTEIIKCLLNAGADPNANEAVMILLPVTSPIPTISDWSYAGIMSHVHSEKGQEEVETLEFPVLAMFLQKKRRLKEDILFLKSKGEELINAGDYLGAIYPYSKVIDAFPTDADAPSSRSFCWAQLETGDGALEDALSCIRLRPYWPEAYYRAGVAWMLLEDFEKAADAFYDGWKLNLEDEELERAFWESGGQNSVHLFLGLNKMGF